ncbi:hypothetical protein ACFQ6Q_00380 [Streptomyces sp. NPDC056437]|uniref:hypothetical protein n=1 Tax=Streptomyces sp. NPDC056437 TaxID=3345816 RepID=UPI0036942FE4
MSLDIGREFAALRRQVEAQAKASRLSSASLDDTALEVRGPDGGLTGIVGKQYDGTTAVNIVNGVAPPAPSAPTAADALGGIGVAWDGLFADGAVLPLDWQRVEVHASPLAVFTPMGATLQATIETPQGGGVYIPATGPLYVRLLARNTSGTASVATAVIGPYSPRPVAGDIGPGDITETLIADDAISTPKLQAGSVDATALKADAITGKTITGGVITGSVLRTDTAGERVAINESGNNAVEIFDSADRLVGVVDGEGLRLIGDNGSEIGIDPGGQYADMYLTSQDGSERAIINVSGSTPEEAYIGIHSGRFPGNGFTDVIWRTAFGGTFWIAERVRLSDLNTCIGGRTYLSDTVNHQHFYNSLDTTQNTGLAISANMAALNNGRLEIVPNVSALSAIYMGAPSGYTGNMLRLQKNSVDQFVVDNSGNATAIGALNAGATDWTHYTPTVAGAGTATWSVRDGWYKKIGKQVHVQMYIAFSAAGTGTGTVTLTLPSTPYRGSANRRQYLPMCTGGMVAGTNSNVGGVAIGNINTSGSGAVVDQLRGPTDILYRGDNFSATATITVNGWYREV